MKVLTIHDDGTVEEFDIEDDLFELDPLPRPALPTEAFGHAASLAASCVGPLGDYPIWGMGGRHLNYRLPAGRRAHLECGSSGGLPERPNGAG